MRNGATIDIDGETHISVATAAQRLAITRTRLYKVIRDGELKPRRRNGTMYLRRSDVEQYKRRRDRWLRSHNRPLPKSA